MILYEIAPPLFKPSTPSTQVTNAQCDDHLQEVSHFDMKQVKLMCLNETERPAELIETQQCASCETQQVRRTAEHTVLLN